MEGTFSHQLGSSGQLNESAGKFLCKFLCKSVTPLIAIGSDLSTRYAVKRAFWESPIVETNSLDASYFGSLCWEHSFPHTQGHPPSGSWKRSGLITRSGALLSRLQERRQAPESPRQYRDWHPAQSIRGNRRIDKHIGPRLYLEDLCMIYPVSPPRDSMTLSVGCWSWVGTVGLGGNKEVPALI